MKKLAFLIAAIFAVFFVINNLFPEPFEKAERQITLPFKIAQLAARAPEEKIAMPVRNVRVRQIADTWGAPRGADREHQGQDIFAPRGSKIYSATEGYVVRIGENSLGGKIVSVAGAGGRFYYYAHLDDYAADLAVGDYVTPDTILGFVGNTGNARTTPPHLHFGVYTQGGAINPLPLLSDQTNAK